ncbi:MAG: hypothetical protein RL354_469 [Planctomycetota bacterium]|jgi:outer membrane protein TolC
MNSRTPTAPCVLLVVAAMIASGCASPHIDAPRDLTPPPAPTSAIDAEAAAARAVAVSAKVHAAGRRLEAASARAHARSLPPDPSIAIGLGIPIDGLGGSPASVSIMEGLSWLLSGERQQRAAEGECDAAAAELVAIAAGVAAEARRLVRTLDAARARRDALARSAAARSELAEIEQAALAEGESTAARVAALVGESAESRMELASAALAVQETEVALMSLLALESQPAVAPFGDVAPATDATLSLDVLRARARVARAEAEVDLGRTPLGADPQIGVGISRDLEDRRSVDGTIELTVPLFRRAKEQMAREQDLAAEHAELAELERIAAVELAHARAAVDDARAQRAEALEAVAASERARAAVERALEAGEASRAELLRASAERDEWRARAAARSIAFAEALARIESRSTAATAASHEAAALMERTR